MNIIKYFTRIVNSGVFTENVFGGDRRNIRETEKKKKRY